MVTVVEVMCRVRPVLVLENIPHFGSKLFFISACSRTIAFYQVASDLGEMEVESSEGVE